MKRTIRNLFALLLAGAILFTSTNVEMVFAEGETPSFSVSKYAEWTDPGSTLDITLEHEKTAGTTDTPQILFLGTLCGHHSLTKDAVLDSLHATASYGDVDYYIYQRNKSSTGDSGVTKTIGSFDQNTSRTDISKQIPALKDGYHASIYDFAEILAQLADNKTDYDYIVMEFDGMRLGHYQGEADATDLANLKKASAYLQDYYDAEKIAWIIPPVTKKDGTPNYCDSLKKYDNKILSTYIYNDYFFDNPEKGESAEVNETYQANVRNTIYLLAPEDLVSGKVTGTITDQETLLARMDADDDERIWVSYEEASKVKIFLEERIGTFRVDFEDKVTPGLTVTGVKGQYLPSGSSKWTDIPAANTSDAGKPGTGIMFYYTSTTGKTGTQINGSFDLTKIYSGYKASDKSNVRMIISCRLACQDPTSSDYLFKEANDYTIQTNVGDAKVSISNGPTQSTAQKSSPELGAYPIVYHFVGERTTATDNSIPTPSAISFNQKYTAEALPTPTGYTIDGWYTDEACTEKFVDKTKVDDYLNLYGKCIPNKHSVTWVTDGDPLTGDFTTGSAVDYNSSIVKPNTPTKTGYTFKAWSPSVPAKMPDADKTFTATWDANEYTVKFDANTGSGTMTSQSFDYDTAEELKTNTFTKTGYEFTGWNTITSGTGISYKDEESVKNLTSADGETITLYAQWKKAKFNITWSTDGDPLTGDYTKGETEYETEIVRPDTPTKTGYTFISWTPDVPDEVPASSKTFTTEWAANKYTVSFDSNTGSGTMNDQEFTYDTAQNLSASTFTKTGYTFTGWSTSTGAAVSYEDKASVKNLTSTSGASVTLYAQWELTKYQIKWVTDGDTLTGNYTKGNTNYNTAIVKPDTPTKTGYTFKAWSPEVPETVPACDKTFTATWDANPYTVTFDANKGEGSMESQNFTYDAAQNLSANGFSRTGYTFAGWTKDQENKGSLYADKASVKNLSGTSGAAVTLYAKWTPITYQVRFNKTEGNGAMENQTLTYDEEKALSAATFSRTGYSFTGWNTAEDGLGTAYADKAAVKNLTTTKGAVIDLYAQWSINSYEMTWVTDGDPLTGDYSKGQVVYNTAITAPETPTKTGYLFKNWSPSVPETMPANVTTITAIWTANSYQVAFDATEGTGSMSNQSFTYDAAQNLKENKFTRTGYTFAGWALTSGGAVAYADKASAKNLTSVNNGVITLYACWTPNTYKINFLANEGNGTMPVESHTYDVAKNLTTNGFIRAGYDFTGWNTLASGKGTSFADGESVLNLTAANGSSLDLYAQWKPCTYTVTLVGNGGTGTDLTEYTHGTAKVLPTDWTKTQAEFIGWFEKADFTGSAATQIPASAIGNKTYYAKWRLTAAYDLFDDPGQMPSGLDSVSLETGDEVVLLYGAPQSVDPDEWTKDAPDQYHMTITDSVKVPNPETRGTYQFAGWDVTDVSGTVTFAAQWLKTDIQTPETMQNKITEVGSGLLDYAKARLAELNAAVDADDTARIQELDVVLTVDDIAAEEIKKDSTEQSIRDIVAIAEGRTLIGYDITIESTVTTRNWDGSQWTVAKETPQAVTDTGAPIVIRVPFDFNRKKDIKAYRYHDAATEFTAEPNALGEFCEEQKDLGALDIHAQLFSTYAIGYKKIKKKAASPAETGVDEILNTEDHIAYIMGYTDGSVRPMNMITRAETAMIFYHLLKDPTCDSPVHFKDVEEGKWYTDAIETLASRGFISGYPDGSFRPDRPITRAEFTAISMHFAKAPDGMGAFGDVGPTHWANNAIASASAYSWVTGYENGTFQPNRTITRAEVSSIVNRMLGRYADELFVSDNFDLMKQFCDLQDDTAWYFYQMIEATNGHNPERHEGNELWSIETLK